MNYYVYIDESGQFREPKIEKHTSIVGGVITDAPIEDIEDGLNDAINKVNKEHKTDFTSNDIHIAPLLHPETTGKEQVRERFISISQDARKALAYECLNTLNQLGLKFVCSTNDVFSFGEQDEQSRYGTVLCAFIHKVIDFIKNESDVTALNIYIAPRSQKCLPDNTDFAKYHQRMVQYISSWVKKALNETSVKVGWSGKQKAGYDLADIACYYLSNQYAFDENKLLKTAPNEYFAQEYQDTESDIITALLKNNEFDIAYRWSDTDKLKKEVIKKLGNADIQSKLINIPGFINIAHELVEKRASLPDALQEATSLFIELFKIARETDADDKKSEQQLVDMSSSALDGILICANHTGSKDQQQEYLEFYRKSLMEIPQIPYYTRQERMLAFRNKAFNAQFNDYHFGEVLVQFQSVVDKRQAEIPVNLQDMLTGEMLGTIGQAYSFMSKDNPSYGEIAEKYFNESLKHFPIGHKFYEMGINFLVTIKWYHNHIEDAIEAFSLHEGFTTDSNLEDWLNIVISTPPTLESAFKISTLFRLLVWSDIDLSKVLKDLESFLSKYQIKQHPYELIYKWLGIAYIKENEFELAIKAFDKSIEISSDLGFTVQTIALSARGLKTICLHKNDDSMGAELEKAGVVASVRELCEKSQKFNEYIESIGDLEKMVKDIDTDDIISVSKWLPFAYA